MKIARYLHDHIERIGVVDGDVVHEIDWSLRDATVLAALGHQADLAPRPGAAVTKLADVVLLAPLCAGTRIFCAGINYLEHQRESADVFVADVPSEPIIFLKDVSAMTAPGAVLHLPEEISESFDWEAELGVVIGAPARNVSEADALAAIAGFTVVNDISARDLQTQHIQWTLGKNNVAATPVGPWIVTRDELGDVPEVEVSLRVNGEVKQSGNTRDMIFSTARLISAISAVTPLLPGDIIATGTPSGVGFKRNPPQFLREGDVVETEISGIGTLRNPVRTRS